MTNKAPVWKITMGLDASPAGDARLMSTSGSSTPQPTSVEYGYVLELPFPRCQQQIMSKGTIIQQEKEKSSTSAAALSSTDATPSTVQERSNTQNEPLTEDSVVFEDIRSQLLQPEEMQEPLESHEESEPEGRNRPPNTAGQKNKKDNGLTDTERTAKRRKTDNEPVDDNAMIRISLIAINGLVSNLQSLESQVHRNEKIGEKFVQAMRAVL